MAAYRFRAFSGGQALRAVAGAPCSGASAVSAERRRERRRLVENYFNLVQLFCETLTPERLGAALELARVPETIRGYGHVKEKNMDAASERRVQLMALYRAITHHNKT
ncbi:DUF6537 domain-containing protein [Massilia phosphatilytica]